MSDTQHLHDDWRQWWVNALVFDALIGNTDRHQDNWGLIFSMQEDRPTAARLAPLFDNGTSLGHERFVERVRGWGVAELDRYISKGQHHVRWAPGLPREQHFALLRKALYIWPRAAPVIAPALRELSGTTIARSFEDLTHLQLPLPLSSERSNFMLRLLTRRLDLLQALL